MIVMKYLTTETLSLSLELSIKNQQESFMSQKAKFLSLLLIEQEKVSGKDHKNR